MMAKTALTDPVESGATEAPPTRTAVLHPDLGPDHTRRAPEHGLAEAVSLAHALPGLEVVRDQVVRLPKPHPGHLFGTGKLAELKQLLHDDEIDLVVIDGPVTPVQQRNLEKEWKVKLLDRTGLILEIFADRAATREGVLQVELAALSYQRTRLVRAWTHLERQRGGLGFVGGPGETQIEADRRAIDDAVNRIRKQLAKVVKTRALHRAARAKVPYPIVALVGYTNAGKSTLFNYLTGADVFAKDMLFATLDPTMRAVTLPGGTDIILSDTVGFISDLPTQLVAAFRATLEEVLDADLICHVRDISHPESDAQARDVNAILAQLGVSDEIPKIELWNKIDAVDTDTRASIEAIAARREDVFTLSAVTGEGRDPALAAIATRVTPATHDEEVFVPFADGRARAWLHGEDIIQQEAQEDEGFRIQVRWTTRQAEQFAKMRR
ncbi:GTPase HflX [Thalassobacter stenotrophicus]|uniref:GTPase HflX n=1 Tax=Thalassobacter stenotrophicus TaxID=266809 RepID=UPI0022A978CB|nr:GTPase HflX [Thalassobacter stenotrophicus]UYP69105.1 GTPase HflX [Thalassobacter stenotrophicus]